MKSFSARAVISSSLVCLWALCTYACSVEDENPAPPGRQRAETLADGATNVTPGSTEPVGAPICAKYGNIEGVNALAADILARARTDCRVSPLFSNVDRHATECFQKFIGGGFQCPGVSYVQGTTTDSRGERCESVLPGVSLGAEDWKAFGDFNVNPASAARIVLEGKGLVGDELRALASVFEGKKISLTDREVPNGKYKQCAPNCASGGQGCIRAQPDAGVDAGGDSGGNPQDASTD